MKFNSSNFEKLVKAICLDHRWEIPQVQFHFCGIDFGYGGVLHLNPDEDYSGPGALVEHLGIILGQMNGMSPDSAEEYFGQQRMIWESRN